MGYTQHEKRCNFTRPATKNQIVRPKREDLSQGSQTDEQRQLKNGKEEHRGGLCGCLLKKEAQLGGDGCRPAPKKAQKKKKENQTRARGKKT